MTTPQEEWNIALAQWNEYVTRRTTEGPWVTDETRREYATELKKILAAQKKAERANIEAYF